MTVEEINPYEFWVILVEPKDEQQEIELMKMQGELGTDALIDYGVNFHFMPAEEKMSVYAN